MMTIKGVAPDKQTGKMSVAGYLHNINGEKIVSYTVDDLKAKHGMTDEVLEEVKAGLGSFFILGKGIFFPEESVLNTLCQRVGMGAGDFARDKAPRVRFHRDAGIVAFLSEHPSQLSVGYRDVDDGDGLGSMKKVLYVCTDRMKPLDNISMTRSTKILFEKELGNAVLAGYRIDNHLAEIFYQFPDKATDFSNVYSLPDVVTPGVRISFSDAAQGSFSVIGTMSLKHSTIYLKNASFARKHTKNAEEQGIIKDVDAKVFREYTKVPDRLMELMAIDVKSPLLEIEHIVKDILNVKGTISQKAERQLLEEMTAFVNPTLSYTAYDIAVEFIEAGSNLEKTGMSPVSISKIREMIPKVLDYSFK